MLVSSIGSAQTFDFSCADANGITTHDGFELVNSGIYRNSSYELDLHIQSNFRARVTPVGVVVPIIARDGNQFQIGSSNQSTYDNAVAWILENRTPTQTCTPTLNIAEGLIQSTSKFPIVGIEVVDDTRFTGVRHLIGETIPSGPLRVGLLVERPADGQVISANAGVFDIEITCDFVLGVMANITGGVNLEIDNPSVINIPEALNPWIQRITFQDIQNNSIKHTPDVGGNETNIYDDGDFIPEEATHYRIRIRRTLGTNNGSYETEQISVPNSGDLNVCLSVVDIQDGLRIVNPNSSDNINGIFIGADYYSNGAVIPPGPHTNVRVSGVFNGRSYPYIDHAFNIGEECGNIVITKDTYSTFECSITVDIEPGLSFRLSGNTFVIDGLILNNQRYYNGDIIPQSDSDGVFGLFSDIPDVDGYVVAQLPFGIRVDSDHCGSIGVPEDFEGVFKLLIPTLEGGGDISGMTYSLAGKTYTISDEGGAGHTYRFQAANDPVVFFVGSNSLSVADGRIVFGASSIWDGGHVINTTGTEELERALPLVTAGIKIFYPNGRSNVTDAFFAIESDFLVTDAANMNKNIIDLTPVNGITVFPGDENVITSGSDFSALVTESRYYAYVLTNNKIGVGLVTGSGASLVITDTENNLKIGSARGGTLLWEINGPRRINDVGEFKYIKVVNQRNSSWDDVEGYYRIHPAINGGFTDQTSASYQAAATSGNLTVVTTVDPDMISEQAGPGDFFVIRDNSIDRQGFTVAYARSRQTAGLVYGLIFSFGAPNLGTSLNFNVGHAQKLTNPVLQ